ncbi:hypothetical protein SteCoe_33100 [Stentor coeruleus]|uniref:dual-specificity kinase n=1 Tax=Stentor coeruleus TaxID=5963 RepID=A0A1R2AXJ7_9CILI|nr:hypothetical protein SteCoe_33100 [Stentor coeruleus]
MHPISSLNARLPSKVSKKYCSSSIDRLKSPICLTGLEVIKTMNDALTEYELKEVVNYSEVYFIGDHKSKIHGSLRELNWGYDDNDANYKVLIGDHLAYRYEILSMLGKGSFGQVFKCLDYKTSEQVAVKILKNKAKFHKQGEVEISILKTLNEADNGDLSIVRMIRYFTFRCHICIVFELLSLSVYDFLRKNHYRGFAMQAVKEVAVKMLGALKLMREKEIVHGDLKPENILFISENTWGVKIIDYGSGCFQSKQIYTYIQSRFYRCPEVMLGMKYTPSIDMWSFGCIIVEMVRGYPLFPGKNEEDLMGRIIEILGSPPRDLIINSPRLEIFFDKSGTPLPYFDSKGHLRPPGCNPLRYLLPSNEDFYNFIHKCLEWDPLQRLTPSDALIHDWIAKN